MVTNKAFTASNISEFINAFQPFTVGMDQTLRDMYNFNTRTLSTGNYPPYNISTIDDDHYDIEVAVAGFGEEDITVTQKDQDLEVKGNVVKDKDSAEDTYLHKGIANRSFTRKFKLGLHVQVTACDLKNGMLTIHLEKIVPEEEKPKVIPINK